MISLPLFKSLSSTYHGSIYKTKPLEVSLKIRFSDQNLFGGIQSRHKTPIKVAITSTTVSGGRDVVFSNYNRPDPMDMSTYHYKSHLQNAYTILDIPYEFVRPGESSKEVKIWEV